MVWWKYVQINITVDVYILIFLFFFYLINKNISKNSTAFINQWTLYGALCSNLSWCYWQWNVCSSFCIDCSYLTSNYVEEALIPWSYWTSTTLYASPKLEHGCHSAYVITVFFLIYLFLQWFELRGWYWWHCWTSLFVYLMVFNATFNNISVILWRSVLLVEETGGPGENHRPVASHWQTLLHNVVHLSLIQHHILNCYYGINTHLRPHTMKSNAINVSNINKDNTEEYYTYCFLNLRRVWRYQRCY